MEPKRVNVVQVFKSCDKCPWEAIGAPHDVDRDYARHMSAAHHIPTPASER